MSNTENNNNTNTTIKKIKFNKDIFVQKEDGEIGNIEGGAAFVADKLILTENFGQYNLKENEHRILELTEDKAGKRIEDFLMTALSVDQEPTITNGEFSVFSNSSYSPYTINISDNECLVGNQYTFSVDPNNFETDLNITYTQPTCKWIYNGDDTKIKDINGNPIEDNPIVYDKDKLGVLGYWKTLVVTSEGVKFKATPNNSENYNSYISNISLSDTDNTITITFNDNNTCETLNLRDFISSYKIKSYNSIASISPVEGYVSSPEITTNKTSGTLEDLSVSKSFDQNITWTFTISCTAELNKEYTPGTLFGRPSKQTINPGGLSNKKETIKVLESSRTIKPYREIYVKRVASSLSTWKSNALCTSGIFSDIKKDNNSNDFIEYNYNKITKESMSSMTKIKTTNYLSLDASTIDNIAKELGMLTPDKLISTTTPSNYASYNYNFIANDENQFDFLLLIVLPSTSNIEETITKFNIRFYEQASTASNKIVGFFGSPSTGVINCFNYIEEEDDILSTSTSIKYKTFIWAYNSISKTENNSAAVITLNGDKATGVTLSTNK